MFASDDVGVMQKGDGGNHRTPAVGDATNSISINGIKTILFKTVVGSNPFIQTEYSHQNGGPMASSSSKFDI